ncbi:MAG: DoxX family protein [Thermoplasmata archaeon]|nr:DoxX family protein [Thermoplasmata archaeon]MCI4354656.1 DoxX family protein [Thermoplasmata archaeon]
MSGTITSGAMREGWIARNAHQLKVAFRVVFGLLWVIDGAFKFAPGLVDQFPGMIVTDGQPAWLQPWFQFWATQAASNAAFWVYTTGVFELAVGLALVFGFMRKISYIGGAVLSMFIWAVPEAFGGPYGTGSTDPGGGVVYAMVFLMLIVINAAYGPSKWSLDYLIEQRFPAWKYLAEFRYGGEATPSAPSAPSGKVTA